MKPPVTLDLFCRVIDNFGDIGVCWRLAQQLYADYGISVRLFVDDLGVFQKIVPGVVPTAGEQRVRGVRVVRWSSDLSYTEAADAVIEAFACNLPDSVVEVMAARTPRPVWVNLEYLSAEDWVEGYHMAPSCHPLTGLKKYFFFPGLTEKTGGLIRENDLIEARNTFQMDKKAQNKWRSRYNIPVLCENTLDISLFCYKTAPFDLMMTGFSVSAKQIRLFVPAGVGPDSLCSVPGVEVCRVPFVPQSDYDYLLWTCDLNFVRGEDSFARALLSVKPLLWHIYPQDDLAHHAKLQAFLSRYTKNLPSRCAEVLAESHKVWNQVGHPKGAFPGALLDCLPDLHENARVFAKNIEEQAGLAEQLLTFIGTRQNT